MKFDEGMRILFVAPYVPSRIRVRPYQFIRHLAAAGHHVTVVALEDAACEPETLAELRDICEGVHVVSHPGWRAKMQSLAALPTPTPLWAAYCRSDKMARLLRELRVSGRFDVAHVEHLRAAHFEGALRGMPLVFDAVDCITALQRQMMRQPGSAGGRLVSLEEWVKLRRYEPRAYRRYHRISVTSEYDAQELRRLDGRLSVEVIPNGVDLEYFRQDGELPEPDTLVFSGKMSYRANDDAARFLIEEILPRLRTKRPNAKLIVVGSGPSAALRALADRAGGVTVTGYVDDIRPYLKRAMLAICPMRIGVGIQNKALEAMAMGRPVVCSPIVCRVFGGDTGGGVVSATDAEEYAGVCARILAHPEAALRAGDSARAYVERHYRWSGASRELVRLYEEARGEVSPRG